MSWQRALGPLVIAMALMPAEAEAVPTEPSAGGRVDFTWDAPIEGCPAEGHVLAELERLLGGSIEAQGGRRLSAIARARLETDGRWNLRLTIFTAEGTFHRKEMLGDDCEVLADAAALLAAMAIDPRVLDRQQAGPVVEKAEQARVIDEAPDDAESPPHEHEHAEVSGDGREGPEREVEPEPEPEPPRASPEPVRHRGRPRWIGARLGAGVSSGDLPGASALHLGPVLRLGSIVQWEHARLELEGHYAVLRRKRFEDAPEVGADFRQGFLAVRGCGVLHPRRAPLELPICAGMEGGATAGRGVGFARTQAGRRPWLAADANAGLVWVLHPRVGVGLVVEAWLPLRRDPFTADDIQLWRPWPAGVRLLIGVEARFPVP